MGAGARNDGYRTAARYRRPGGDGSPVENQEYRTGIDRTAKRRTDVGPALFGQFDLFEIQLDRGGAAEDRHRHLDPALSKISSSTTPLKLANGPSSTLTWSRSRNRR